MGKKRGIFFTTDAVIAVTIILVIVIIAYPILKSQRYETPLPKDILTTLSSLKVGEIQNQYIQSLISQGIADANKSLLDQIGIFSITNFSIAQNIMSIVLQDLSINENIGIWYGNNLVYAINSTSYENATNVETERHIVSGVGGLNGTGVVSGFSARGFLSNTFRSQYTYFGGYVGDGNISSKLDYFGVINSAEIEIAINNNFTLYINGINSGTYAKSASDFAPVKYDLNSYLSNFQSGNNTIELRGNNLYIAGGFLKITYETNATYQQPTRQYFPGIAGIPNLYDGFSTTGGINSMDAYLHYNIPYETFLTIGNVTVWNGSSAGETVVNIPNSQLSTFLNYNSLSNKTVPIRFGAKNLSIFANGSTGDADVILITDVSGSMNWRLDSDLTGTNRNCNDPLLYDPSTKRISLAKCLDQQFVATILSGTNNRVGLVSFDTNANGFVNLTNNLALLNDTINGYTPNGATCVSCAINRAYLLLKANSNSTRKKYVIAMTDGVTNIRSTPVCHTVQGSAKTNTSTILVEAGTGGAIAHYTNSLWQIPSNSLWQDINNVDLLNNTLGFAVGTSYQISRWNGAAWSSYQDLGSQNLYGINIYNSTLAFAVGDQGKIARWNGASWAEYQDVGSDNLRDVKIFNNTLGFAVGHQGVIYRWAGGSNLWSLYQDVGNEDLKSLDIFSGTYGLAVGGSSGNVYIWNGNSWTLQQSLGSLTLTDVDIFNATLAFATTDNDRIYRKSGSSSWAQVYLGAGDLNTIVIFNSTAGFASGWPREGIVYWNGNIWNKTYPWHYYQGNSTTGLSCSDLATCNQFESAPMLNANYSSCRVYKEQNATVYSIGFGPVATCSFAAKTLLSVAQCGNGSYYASDNATQLQQIYQNISQSILQLSYAQQTAQVTGNASGVLYSDSYIDINYTRPSVPFGLILSLERQFSNSTSGNFSLYPNSTLLETKVTSYSGSRWTEKVKINNNLAYDINYYGTNYVLLGDPYSISIPNYLVQSNNNVSLTTAVSATNVSSGSQYNKIIYTITKNFSSFSQIVAAAQGCNWQIGFEDGANLTTTIPSTYSGSNSCTYQGQAQNYDSNDAFQIAVFNLLQQLDLDSNGLIDIKFTQQALQIDLSQITGIPFTWYTEVQVRSWI